MGKREYLIKSYENVSRTRREHGITIDAISSGLCSGSQVSLWENGNATLDFAIRYRIYSRLFIEDSVSGWMIDNAEYQIWRRQNNIVWLLCIERYDEAKNAIEEYLNEPDLKPMERQFVLRMKAIHLMATGGKREEIYKYTKEAFDITVPDFSWDNLIDMILSSEELDMLLDIERYSENNKRRFGAVIGYLMIREIKEPYQRKIFPKATYYYLDAIDIDAVSNLRDLIILKAKADYAIECLGNTGSCGFMLELLNKKEQLIKRIIAIKPEKEESLGGELERTKDYIETMTELYERAHIRPDTIIIPDTYIPCLVYNMSEIIYKRRMMLGISQTMLAKDICDIKTVRRWHQGKSVPQEYVKGAILDRLRLENKGYMYEQALMVGIKGGRLDYLADYGDMWLKNRCRLSYIYNLYDEDDSMEDTVDSDYYLYGGDYRGYIDRYLEELQRAIEDKYPIDTIITAEDRWFSGQEIFDYYRYIYLYNKDPEKKDEYIGAIKSYYDERLNTDLELSEWVVMKLVYDMIRNEYGNLGKYDESNELSEYLLKRNLCYRRIHMINQLLYNNWWNDNERRKESGGEEQADSLGLLKQCIDMAELIKDKSRLAFYKNKYESLNKS